MTKTTTHDSDVTFIRALAELLRQNDLTEIEVMREYGEDDSLNVRVSRATQVVQQVAAAAPVAVINADDPAGRRLAGQADGRVVTFGAEQPADYRATVRRMDGTGTELSLSTPAGPLELSLRMVGPNEGPQPRHCLRVIGPQRLKVDAGAPD